MTTPIDPHAWFHKHLDAFIADELLSEEKTALTAHAAICAACNSALLEARQADQSIRTLFSPITPTADFEEKLIMNLQHLSAPRSFIHPSVIRAATGVAAVIVLGGFGLIGHRAMRDGKFPELSLPQISFPQFAWLSGTDPTRVKASSNLRQMGEALRMYTADDLATAVPEIDVRLKSSLDSSPQAKARYDDLLRYPADWADINQTVTEGGDGNGRKSNTWNLQLPEQLAKNAEDRLDPGATAMPRKSSVHGEQGRGYGELSHIETTKSVPDRGTMIMGGQSLDRDLKRDKEATLQKTELKREDSQGLATKPQLQRNLSKGAKLVSGIERSGGLSPAHKDDTPLKPAQLEGVKLGLQAALQTDYFFDGTNTNSFAKTPEALYYKPAANTPAVANVAADGIKLPVAANGTVNLTLKDSDGDRKNKLESELPRLRVVLSDQSEKAKDLNEVAKQDLKRGEPTDAEGRQKAAFDVTGKDAAADGPKVAGKPETPRGTDEVKQPPIQQFQRKIIRNGQVEFEVDSFDSTFMQIGKIVVEEGGYVSSTDSEKLSNGKVKGTVTVRVPPDHLDVLILKLRGLGDLKSQKVAAQDITKQYTDLESGLRASRTMEDRLLEIIKTGKGSVKDLVEAEKQLGVYREHIEQVEGELRYYGNLISLSTLNITLYERDIKTPTAAFETEEVQAGIEVEDVEKARNDALKAIDEAKGRVIESNLKKLDAGQLTATIVAELSPEAAGAFTDRLKQLGRVARLEADRKQTTQGGIGAPTGIKMERKATRFNISLYNLANIAPRETVNLTLAAEDVETAYKAILSVMNADDAVSMGRIVSSTLNSQKKDQTSGAITLEVKSDKANAVELAIRATGEVLHVAVSENPDSNNVTRAKRGYSISLISIAQVAPRETQTLQVAAKNVPAAYAKLLTALQDPKQPSRILSSQLNEQDRQNVTGQIDVEVPRAAVGAIEAAITGTESDVYSRNISRANESQNTLDTKVRLSVTLVAADRLPPRETTTIAVEVENVEAMLNNVVNTPGAKAVERQISKQQNGRIAAHAVIDVPLTSAPAILDSLRNLGTVRVVESSKNPQVPEGPLARARFDVTLGNAAPIVSPEDGVGARLHQGLQTSLNGLTFSLMLIVIGVCLVGPFALVIWGGWKFLRRGKLKATTT